VCVQQSLDVEEGEWEPNLNCLSSPFSRVPKVVYAQILLCFQLTRRTFYRQTQQKKKDVERRTVVVHIYIYLLSFPFKNAKGQFVYVSLQLPKACILKKIVVTHCRINKRFPTTEENFNNMHG
jgi:hypothetical protein